MNTAHTNRGNVSQVIPGARRLMIVVIILMEPNMELRPAICKLNIDRSTAAPK